MTKEMPRWPSTWTQWSKFPIAHHEVIAHAHPGAEREAPGAGTPEQPIQAQNQDDSTSSQLPPSRAKTLRPASPESDATAISTEPAQSSMTVSPVQKSNFSEKALSQEDNDDVEPSDEPLSGYRESDPIEPEPTQPALNQPAVGLTVDPVPRESRRRPPNSEQPSRRSDRLANRRPSVARLDVTVPLIYVSRKTPLSVKQSILGAEEDPKLKPDEGAEVTRKSALKHIGKAGRNSVRRHSPESGDDVSPPAVQEDDSPPAPPPSEQTRPDPSSAIDELWTSTQGLMGKLFPGEDESSALPEAEKETPLSIRQGIASRGGRGSAQPLFFPGSSQAPKIQASPSPSESESESEKAASLLPRKTPTRSTPGGGPFRRLTEIASQDIRFSTSKNAQQFFKDTPSLKAKQPIITSYDGEDDEGSSSSSDDTEPSSHIPKERRAGAVSRRKEQGLSSLFE
ncbi:hypothetical protein B0F90DRAFT_1078376 [Multifurca ochricompacta]|uniref:Uncharacterized protein n=1 Tax=Multifurca ochricompacta TaxID=376703 RepID=A0AAD4MAP6_9AGAM|nr:hypothetical protein B0F90DRAFT_1078376 [Multifurca ochricompacta]